MKFDKYTVFFQGRVVTSNRLGLALKHAGVRPTSKRYTATRNEGGVLVPIDRSGNLRVPKA